MRAALFAAVCVLLAATGHILMSGHAVPGRTLGAALAGTAVGAWALGGRERGLLAVTSAAVAFQSALHLVFSWSQSPTATWPTGGAAGEQGGSSGDMTMSPMGMGHMEHMGHMGPGQLSMDHLSMGHVGMGHSALDPLAMDHMAMGHLPGTASPVVSSGHDMTDMTSSVGMLSAHLLAALLSGLWLAYGERAVFRLLRTVPARLFRPLGLLLAVLPVVADRPRIRRARTGDGRVPRRLLLARTLLTRGPPRAFAVL
ncbi:hypothetical protein ABTY59_30380 [Streptomyces sp. NPDC096079]|uniref:hypothetical protein n=1 Tax=Streptomyces sp. NPDC096079 TaxID=3155820 RepID=UPI003317FE3B